MFIDEWVGDDAYKQLPPWPSLTQELLLWPVLLDPHPVYVRKPRTMAARNRSRRADSHNCDQLSHTPAGKDAFRRSLPLAVPKLETNEELVVVRAKKRPVMLIQPEAADMAVNNRGYRGRVQRKRSLMAPIFGLADAKTGAPEFNPEWVDRIRKMEFPQLVFLPNTPGLLEADSIARLDELQSVFTPHLDPTQFALGDEMRKILIGQVQLFFANVGPNYYTELREMLLKS